MKVPFLKQTPSVIDTAYPTPVGTPTFAFVVLLATCITPIETFVVGCNTVNWSSASNTVCWDVLG